MRTEQESQQLDPSSPKGIGLDVGTMNFVSSRYSSPGVVSSLRMRDVFLDLDISAKKMLRIGKISYVERDEEGDIVVLGDAAMEIASTFGREVRRPLKSGLISPNEAGSLSILAILISSVLGEPRESGEVCYFSVPAAPIDVDRDVVYHRGIFERIVTECGYSAFPSNEAMAIVYSEAADENFSGLGMSFGAGMSNVALSVNAVSGGVEFSVARAGDWIDRGASTSLGQTAARICSLKERGVNLMSPKGREEEAISFYYKALIDYVLQAVAQQFKARCQISLPKSIPIIVSGGTSLAGGFMDLFETTFAKHRRRFPIEISDIRHAKKPLQAVSQGLLVQAMQEYSDGE